MEYLVFAPEVHLVPDVWKSDFSLTRAAWDLPCPTITATGAQGRGGIYHPEENRGFTIDELKRLTGLPDDFQLSGTFAQKAERIGRMVPPLMTKSLAESVYTKLLKPK
jgi:DNA (cytosine-5)-methyltransferase 1